MRECANESEDLLFIFHFMLLQANIRCLILLLSFFFVKIVCGFESEFIVSVSSLITGEEDEDDGTVPLDDDNAMSLLRMDVGGWNYPVPKAEDPPAEIPDNALSFAMTDPNVLLVNKQHMPELEYDRGFQHALWFLKKKADRLLNATTRLTVVGKDKTLAPGHDPHDYVSLARYFWPNKSQPNGLPYERHDGLVNPEIYNVSDYKNFHDLVHEVRFLSLAYHYFDNETYAERATERIHDWFVNPETRMNPHLQYASLVRGYKTGRAKGIIDFHIVPDLLDSVAILQQSRAWKPRMNAHLRHWFSLYMDWLTKSPNGVYERDSHNNHGK